MRNMYSGIFWYIYFLVYLGRLFFTCCDRFFCVCIALLSVVLVSIFSIFSVAAQKNYPGAFSMAALHRDIDKTIQLQHPASNTHNSISVHIDVLACVSGVTRLTF